MVRKYEFLVVSALCPICNNKITIKKNIPRIEELTFDRGVIEKIISNDFNLQFGKHVLSHSKCMLNQEIDTLDLGEKDGVE